MRSRFVRAALAALTVVAFAAPVEHARAQGGGKALVYCPVGIDDVGCSAIVNALAAQYVGGVDKGYDGSGGTIDLATADLTGYRVLVIPSLADDSSAAPYGMLRDPAIARRLHGVLFGRMALWSGTPDQGSASRVEKDVLIRNLATWAGGNFAKVLRPGLVVLQDQSANTASRYDWLSGLVNLDIVADTAPNVYSSIKSKDPAAAEILSYLGIQLSYPNMASFGFQSPAPAAAFSMSAAQQTGTSVDGQMVLVTASSSVSGAAEIHTDKDDYAPGDTVIITGTGFKPGENVTITLQEDPQLHPQVVLTSTADNAGNFTNRQFAMDQNDLNVRFVATAVGDQGSTAQTTFTDGNVRIRSNASGITFLLTWVRYSNTSCGASVVDSGQVTVGFSGGARFTKGAGNTESIKEQAAAFSVQGGAFTGWSADNGTDPFTVIDPLTICVTGNFPGTREYVASYNTLIATTVVAAAASGTYGGTTSLTATLTQTSNSAALSGKSISFKLNGTTVGSATTNASGVATLSSVSLVGINAGTYTPGPTSGVSATFAGDATHATSTGSNTLTVNQKSVTPAITASNKVYDGTTTALTTCTVSPVVGTDDVACTGTASFADKNVGNGKTVTATAITLTGTTAPNYVLSTTTATTTANITVRPITVTATTDTKVYDQTTTSSATPTVTVGTIVGGDIGTFTQTFDTKNVGTNKTLTPAGSVSDGNSGNNYAVTFTPVTTGTITALGITGSITADNKVYDGNTTASILTRTLAGVIAPDAVTYTGGTATFDNRNAGTGKTVTGTGLSLAGADAGNYTVNGTALATANITARPITVTAATDSRIYDATTSSAGTPTVTVGTIVSPDAGTFTQTFDTKNVGTSKTLTPAGSVSDGNSGNNYAITFAPVNTGTITTLAITGSITAANKVYDGNTTASIATRTLAGVIAGDVVNYVGGTATFSDKNVANGKTVTATGLSLSGTDAGNYSVNTSATTTANITTLAITGNITADDKVYDGNTSATINSRTLTGVIAPDAVTYTGGTATFDTKHVGIEKPVTATGLSLTGADAGNYTVNSTATTAADITPRALAITATGINKIYDGTTTATVTLADNRVAGDVFTDSYTSATFADKNVGNGKPVSVAGIAITGTDAGNYTFNTTASTTADITPRALTVSATGINKVYDGTTTATVTLADNRVSGDVFTDSYTSATFAEKHVGNGKPVSVTGIAITGTDAGNYTFNPTASTTADITARAITVTAATDSRIYNATTSSAGVPTVTTGSIVSGDNGNFTQTFDTKNVGTSKTLTPAGSVSDGNSGNNYNITFTPVTTGTITPLAITGSITAASKVYDATAAAAILTRTLAGVLGTDDVSYVGGAATFADKNVGNGKTVTATSLSLSGGDAGNYTVNTSATTTANITPLAITGNITADDKVYDGNTSATILTRTLTGVISPDVVAYDGGTATFDTKHVGTGKTVTGTGLSLTGADAGNYTVNSSATTTADITPRALAITATGINKIYDGTTTATVTLADNRVAGDVFTDSYTTAAFNNKNVGTGKPVSVAGISIAGTDAGNYTFNTTASTTADITPRTLTVTATGINKVYDGTTTATVTLADDRVAGDVFTDNYTSATFDTKHVGNGKPVSVTGIAITGTDAGNYTFNPTASTTADITARAITVTAATDSRIYNATTSSAGMPTVTTGTIVSGDNGNFTQTFDTKNVGTNKTLTPAGSVSDGNSSNNYNITFTPVATGTITPLAITGSITAANKIYDGNTTASITTRTLAGVISGDVVSYDGGTATFSDKNVANGKTVTATGLNLIGADAGNYSVNTTAATTADITPLAITGSITAANKIYDGNTTASITTRTLAGVVSGDVVNYIGGTATFSDKNVGTGKTVTGTGLSLDGGDAGNYTVNATATTTADITPRALAITATGINKIYDGTTNATVTLADNRVSGDVFTDSYASASFADKNVGTAKPVSVAGISISGADAGNYTFNATASTTADITQRALTITATGINKVYDGTTSATVTLADNRVAGDVFTDSYTGATFDTRHVGTGKPVSVAGISISGTDAGNYTFNTTTSTTADITARAITVTAATDSRVYNATTSSAGTPTVTTGTIAGGDNGNFTQTFDTKNVGTNKTLTPAGSVSDGNSGNNYTITFTPVTTGTITPLGITGSITADNKVYDGNTAATILTRTLAGVIGGDAVSYVGGTATFADKNVGNGKTVTATGLSLSGGDAGNYTVNASAVTTANITPLGITGSITADNKVYDGNNSATILTRTLAGVVSGDDVSYTGGTATFSDKNVGNGKTVTGTGLNLSGGDAGNYTVNSTAMTTANIAPLAIVGSITAANKVYDATTAATITTRTLAGQVSGDDVSYVGGTATFADKNVANGKAVSASGLSLSGADAGNYTVNSTAGTTANITPLGITGSITADNKVYDGNTTAAILSRTLAGVLSGDVVSYVGGAATFDNKNVGNGKTVTGTGLALSGADAGNYTVNSTAVTTANITPLGITGSITADNKVYDGNATATILTRTLAGVVSGDVVSYVGGTATFDNKNVGTGKPVNATGLSLSGLDAGNYTVNATAATTANITPRPLTVSATGINKVYDANTVATVTLSDNRVAGDVFTDNYTTATFADANAGNGKPVSVSGISIAGADAANYTFNTTATTTANITPRPLTVDADDKSMNFGDAPPTFTATFTNFATGENAANLTGTVQFTTAPVNPITNTTFAGLYTITPFGVSSPNYVLGFTTGTLTISDGTKPIVSNTVVGPNPVALNTPMTITANISDATTGHSDIASACYRIDTGAGPGACVPMTVGPGGFSVTVTGTIPGQATADVFEVCVYGTDAAGNTNLKMDCALVAVYDPSAGFVTGGGWITSPAGAYPANPALTGKATFGFVAKYKKGQQTPEGNTEFQFHSAGMNFKSMSYDWLVVAGSKAQYKGVGTVNGTAGYGFMLTAVDGDLNGNKKPDTFRMKIWLLSTGAIVYDNNLGAADTGDPTTTLGGGSIVIHSN